MKVRVVYRNYIPLYSGYSSFWLCPDADVDIIIPEVKPKKFLFKLYRLLKGLPLFPFFVTIGQKLFFKENLNDKNVDIYFYTGMLPQGKIEKPYMVDFEHVHSLFDYAAVNTLTKKKVWSQLSSKKCIGILPWSEAALGTLKRLYGRKCSSIMNKVSVVYPALPIYKNLYSSGGVGQYVLNNRKMKFLFVGRDYARKGLIELLVSFQKISQLYKEVELYVVSNIDEASQEKYKNNQVKFFDAKFSQRDIINEFFLRSDVFVMPTHADTFGMVLLEALSCGMPVITTKQFASGEIIEGGINGLFVKSSKLFLDQMLIPDKKHTGEGYNETDQELVADLCEKMKYLINNPKVVKMMKKKAVNKFKKNQKFNLELRNKKLKTIYEKVNQ